MKKFLALLLAMMMLFAVSAQAEEAYMRQINQTRYVNTLYIPVETFPQVALAANYPELIYSSYKPKDPLFVVFGLPENAIATSFALNTCHLINEDAGIQYSYQMMENYSYETMLNKCENDAYIIFDGADQKAAYLDPDRARAYGLVGVPEIAKGAKLYITIYLDGLGRNVTTEQRVQKLTEVITAEVNRVHSEIKVQLMDPHWTTGYFTGVKIPSLEYGDQMLVFDFPEVTMKCADGTPATARMFPVGLEGNRLSCYAIFDQKSGMQMKVTMETYSYVGYQKEKAPKEVHSIILNNGVDFDVYANGLAENGKSSMVYANHVLSTDAGYSKNQTYYLNIEFDGHDVFWTSVEEIKTTLESIVGNMYFVDPETDPYVPGESPFAAASKAEPAAEPTAESAADPNAWACPECKAENTGNFCTNCGTKKPETKGPWACPGCKSENTGNFCSNCGTKKP